MTQPAKTLNVTEARRELPKILRSVALGGGPVFVGRRGEGQAVIVRREEYEALQAASRHDVTWDDLRLEVATPGDDIEEAIEELRAENRARLEERMSRPARGAQRPAAPPARKGRSGGKRV